MSKPASKKVIGLFVIGAIALAVVAVLALGSGKFFKKTFRAVCYFEGSVGGLGIGAPVVFRGVKIGTVIDIVLRYDPDKAAILIPVFIEVEQQIKQKTVSQEQRREGYQKLIDAGLRARLDMQSIVTGQLQVGLDFYPDKPAKLIGTDPGYLEIPTIPTPFQEFARKVEKIPIDEIFQKILSAVEGIDKVVNSPEITATLRSVSQASDETKNLIKDVRGEIRPLGASLQETVKEVGKVAQNVNGQIEPVASNLNRTVEEVKRVVQNVDARIEPLASNLTSTVEEIRRLVQNVDTQVAQLGPALKETIGEVRGLVKNVDGQVGSLSTTAKEAIEEYGKLARNVDSRIPSLASGLEKNLDELQRTLAQAQETLALLGDAFNENASLYLETTQTLEELSAGIRSIRLLAEYLKRHPESVLWGKGKSGGK
jgi:paraquat-inducible protein B